MANRREHQRDLPGAEPTKIPVNHRKARAGLIFVRDGCSLQTALIKAGYAESTARNQQRNGLTADQCLLEAAKLDPSADPMTLVGEARRAGLRAVRLLLGLSDAEMKEPRMLTSAAKLWETAERYHGKGIAHPQAAAFETLAQRVQATEIVLDAMERKGMISRSRRLTIDVEHGAPNGEPRGGR